jgi:hypothetical protein
VSFADIRRRLERLEQGRDELVVTWRCPTCRRDVLRYRFNEPCEHHALAPPRRPGERVIWVTWRGWLIEH